MEGSFQGVEENIALLSKLFRSNRKAAARDALSRLSEIKSEMEKLKTQNDKNIRKLEATVKQKKLLTRKNVSLSASLIEQEKQIRKYDLVSNALAAKSRENAIIQEFYNLIQTDFKTLCNIVAGINDTDTYDKLYWMKDEFQRIANCPALHTKKLGAIGGGFSSGKSAFVNSFFTGGEIKLAEGIKPVTAIPSYVLSDDIQKIQGINYKGGIFDIEPETYRNISHEFLKSFPFDLKQIIHYTTVLSPMRHDLFEHICLIDTPGYNPGLGIAEHDFNTAMEYIKDAQFLVWMIGLDTNGTVPQSDLDFLGKLDFGQKAEKPLYIIANKAELKKSDDIESILNTFEDVLDNSDIQFAGISAYSSRTKNVYASRKCDIFQFLTDHNTPSRKYSELRTLLDGIFQEYVKKAQADYDESKTKQKEIKRILFHALEGGNINVDDNENKLEDDLKKLLKSFPSNESMETRLRTVTETYEKFLVCLESFCDEVGISRTADIPDFLHTDIPQKSEVITEDSVSKKPAAAKTKAIDAESREVKTTPKVSKDKKDFSSVCHSTGNENCEKCSRCQDVDGNGYYWCDHYRMTFKKMTGKKKEINALLDLPKRKKKIPKQTWLEKISSIFEQLPQDNCGECGCKNCYQFAMKVASKENTAELGDCPYFPCTQ